MANQMKSSLVSLLAPFVAVLLGFGLLMGAGDGQAQSSSAAGAAVKPFLGRWDLTVRASSKEHPSWMEVTEKNGHPGVLMVGFFGHATAADDVRIAHRQMEFLAPPDEGFKAGARFAARITSGGLEGTVQNPDGTSWQWSGRRAPALKRTREPKWGKPVELFNGRNLDGWKFSDPNGAGVWSVEGGTLVKNGSGSEIISIPKFTDFKLHVEFDCGPKANSGVYLRGRYEVQIETNSATDPPDRRMGAIYGFLAPHPALPRTPDVWQTYDITLVGRTLTLVHDGRTVIAHREIPGITGGALDSDEAAPGPIYLQGSEEGRVAFRNIVITPAE
jgi:hypothetical protein